MQYNNRRRFVIVAMLSLAFVTCLAIAAYTGFRIGQAYKNYSMLSEFSTGEKMPLREGLSLSLKKVFGFNQSKFPSAYGQDEWIAHIVYPDIRNGFYVDVGSADGVIQSNTKALDDLGWQGICIDPFPTNMETRTAKVFKEVVYSEKGKKIQFRASGFIGGIVDHLDYTAGWEKHKKAETVEFTTTTLDDILSRANAPNYIHYMSIDIEGAELEALKGLSFSEYKIGALTIEHNWEEPKRSMIRSFLRSKGYRYVFIASGDDYYIFDESS